jgi:prepilin-type N-terminal cleavage/methylation domain-containing protein
MKTSRLKQRGSSAFTLIEMIGVLAVIAILAALLIPKIFEAINNARVNNAVVSYNTVKAAVMDHYAKYGSIDKTTNGAVIPAGASPPASVNGLAFYDGALLTEGFLDKPFITKVSTNSYVRVVPSSGATYDLAGAGGSANDVAGSTFVVEAVLEGVPASDAKDINDRLDGATAPFTVTLGNPDITGRVRYSNTLQTVVIYVTHR